MKLSKPKRLGIIILIALLLFAAKAYYDTNSIEIKHYRIDNSLLGEVLNGFKVAHLSDLHIRNTGPRESKLLEILKEEKPDLIFITGDVISFRGPYEPVMSFFHQLKPSLAVYAVLGNTEYSNENGSCTLCHKEKSGNLKENPGVVFLRNSFAPLKVNGKMINIIGVDDPVFKKSDLKIALKGTNPDHPSILLAHSPEIFDEASEFGFDLLLSGHTHGGQIFLTKYLRKIFPLEASLEFMDGFFQKGKLLMYVSRGVGTSYLPFRLGVKPEIVFFTFANNTNNEKIRMAQMDKVNQSNSSRETQSLFNLDSNNPSNSANLTNSINSTNRINSLLISNHPSNSIFLGISISSILETFNLLSTIRKSFVSNHSQDSNILFDFESESDLKRLDWQCHKWFELSEEHATSGKHSLKVILPPGQYPGINFEDIRRNWSSSHYLKMDIFNPSDETLKFHVRIDDNNSGWEYAKRFDINCELKKGMNHISVPTDSIKTNIHHYPLNLEKIIRMMVFVPNNAEKREIYLDNIRLE
jgi:predicted MPP superfamily phosphohydrolase